VGSKPFDDGSNFGRSLCRNTGGRQYREICIASDEKLKKLRIAVDVVLFFFVLNWFERLLNDLLRLVLYASLIMSRVYAIANKRRNRARARKRRNPWE
jgi:hypothetical protein